MTPEAMELIRKAYELSLPVKTLRWRRHPTPVYTPLWYYIIDTFGLPSWVRSGWIFIPRERLVEQVAGASDILGDLVEKALGLDFLHVGVTPPELHVQRDWSRGNQAYWERVTGYRLKDLWDLYNSTSPDALTGDAGHWDTPRPKELPDWMYV